MPRRRVWVAPVLPPDFTPMHIEGVSLGSRRISLVVSEQGTTLEGVPDGVEVVTEPYVHTAEPAMPDAEPVAAGAEPAVPA
jgi:hypothetical protein